MKHLLLLSLITVFACTESKPTVDYNTKIESIKKDIEPNQEILGHLIELEGVDLYIDSSVFDIESLIKKTLDYESNKSRKEEDKEAIREAYDQLMQKSSDVEAQKSSYLNDYIHPLMEKIEIYLENSTNESFEELKNYFGNYFLIFRNRKFNEDGLIIEE